MVSAYKKIIACALACAIPCIADVNIHWMEARYQAPRGIGYNTGYSTIEAFLSRPICSDSLLFLDLQGHIFNNNKWAANAGLGYRFPAFEESILGVNAFYDYRQGLHGNYNQVGCGFEALGTKWDLHLNGYFPLNDKNEYKDGFLEFKKHRAIFAKRYQFPMTGGDIEIGRELYCGNTFNLHTSLGGYYFNGSYGTNAVGGLFKASSSITNYVKVEGHVSYDSLFKWLGQGVIALHLPFGKCLKTNCCNRRIVESVSRFEIIVEAKHKKKAFAIDPLTGDPLDFIFVNNTRSSGDGTFEHPFPTLLQAQTHSDAADVIYVFSGNGTTSGMNQGIVLQNRQEFVGSGNSHNFSTRFGIRTIPPQTSNFPSISNVNAGTNTVTLANSNVVSGFNIAASPNGSGIRGVGITNAIIDHNNVSGAGSTINFGNMNFNDPADIALVDVSGNVLINNNQTSSLVGILITEHSGDGSSRSYNATIANNAHVLPNQSNFGIRIWTFNHTQAQIIISSNSVVLNTTFAGFTSQLDNAIAISAAGQSQVNTLIQNNTLKNVGFASTGLYLNASDQDGPNIGPSSLNAFVVGNQISDFLFLGAVGGAFSVNGPATAHTLVIDARDNTLINNIRNAVGAGYGGFSVFVGDNGNARVRLINNLSTTDFNNTTYGFLLDASTVGAVHLVVESPAAGPGVTSAQSIVALENINQGTNNGGGLIQFNTNFPIPPINTTFVPLTNAPLGPFD